MDPVTLIITALTAGAAAGGQSVVTDAIKDAYAGLKVLIKRKFAGKPSAEVALTEHENDPQTWQAPLKKALLQEHLDQDAEICKLHRPYSTRFEHNQVARLHTNHCWQL